MKSLVLVAGGKPVLVMLRGDHQLSETKFAARMGVAEFRQAQPDEIRDWFGAEPGSLGPVGVTTMPILADQALAGRRNMIAGANRNDYHLRHVTPGEDFQAELCDLRQVAAGDGCPQCGAPLDVVKTVEVGHIFKLGYKYSESMGLRVLNADGQEVTPIMGSYGIGIERILCCAIELFHDKDGMMLPPAIAPFHVVVTPANSADPAQKEAAERIYRDCLAPGPRRPARRPRRTARRKIQRRRPDRHPLPHHRRQETRRRHGGVRRTQNQNDRRHTRGGRRANHRRTYLTPIYAATHLPRPSCLCFLCASSAFSASLR